MGEVPVLDIGLEEMEDLGYEGVFGFIGIGVGVGVGSGVEVVVVGEEEDWGGGFWGVGFKEVEEEGF